MREPQLISEQKAKAGCSKGCGYGCLTFLGTLLVLGAISTRYTDFLWFSQDVKQPQVFWKMYTARGALFLPAFVIALVVLYSSLKAALKGGMVFLGRPETLGQIMITRILDGLQRFGPSVAKWVALILAIFFATGFAGEWQNYLLASSGGSFGVKDPIFEKDLSFFVFQLPIWQAAVNFLFGLLLVSLVLSVAILAACQGAASLAKIELSRPAIRQQLSLLLGLTILMLGVLMYLKRFEFGLVRNNQFTGAGYAAMKELGAQTVLAVLTMLLGIGTVINSRVGKPYAVPIRGGVTLIILWIVGVGIYPTIMQRFVVEPNKLSVEAPYAAKAMEMTRFGYGLNDLDLRDTDVRPEPTPAEIEASKDMLGNMRLWDPYVMRDSIKPVQALRQYYNFHDVDVDRYTINGKRQMVMLSPRDIDTSDLDPSRRSWVNEKLFYTHGFGLTMSPVNAASPQGRPIFHIRDIPPKTLPELPVDEPRIYFSDYRSPGDYVIVKTKQPEFDYPAEGTENLTTWSGNGGVGVGGMLTKLAFAFALKDGNLLVSPNITSASKLLIYRGITERASKVYPFLKFDADPYIVLNKGRMTWVLDGYTVSNRIPYSAMVGDAPMQLNYIRSPAKITIDAYSGETNAYALDAEEPLLKAYMKIYPGLVRPFAELDAGIKEHLRYPEDMFNLQALQLTQYHVKDPVDFLNNEDAWQMPTEIGLRSTEEPMRPYYVQLRLPDGDEDEFMLILPFTPRNRSNMSGWLAGRCDPANYGKLVLYRYPRSSNLPGPKQMEAGFNQNEEVANINRQLRNEQSDIIVGNLLVVPVGKSVMYVEPLFLQSRSIPIPELKKVILALQDRVVVADTYPQALARLFGTAPPATVRATEIEPPPTASGESGVSRAQLAEALKLAEDADAALRLGDFAKYGQLQKQLRQKLKDLASK